MKLRYIDCHINYCSSWINNGMYISQIEKERSIANCYALSVSSVPFLSHAISW